MHARIVAWALLAVLAAPIAQADTLRVGRRGATQDIAVIAAGLREAHGGDVVLVAPGVYRGGLWVEQSGERGRPIVVRGEGHDGQGVVLEGGGETVNIAEGAHDLVFERMEIRGSGDNLLHVQGGAHDIVLRDLRLHDAGPDGDGIKVNQAHDIVIERVECYHPGPRPDRPDGNPAQECIDLLDVERAVIQDSFLHDGGNMLVYAKGASRDIVIQRNVIAGQGPDAIDPCVGIGAASDRELLRGRQYEAEYVVFRNNVVARCRAGAVGFYDARRAWMVHNTLVDDGPEVVQFRAGNAPREESRDVHVVGNILADSRGAMRGAFVLRSHRVSALDLRGNLYWNGGRAVPATALWDPNHEPAAVHADPGFGPSPTGALESPAVLRWLTPGAAAIDRGVALPGAAAVNDDLLGRRRRGHGRADLGALEAGASWERGARVIAVRWPSADPTEWPVPAGEPRGRVTVPPSGMRGGGPARAGCAGGCAAGPSADRASAAVFVGALTLLSTARRRRRRRSGSGLTSG